MTGGAVPLQRSEHFFAYLQQRAALRELLRGIPATAEELSVEAVEAGARSAQLEAAYRSSLPVLSISRCPFSGALVRHSIDTLGIDGPWWDYADVVRPTERVPATFLALRGALRFDGPVEHTPFLAFPGPAVPYVVLSVLEPEGRAVVLTSLQVGRHQAYAIGYFSDPAPLRPGSGLVNAWGSNHFFFEDNERHLFRAHYEPGSEDLDFDIERWIRSGKLLWIMPGDDTLTLRSSWRDCPFVGLDGTREFQSTYSGLLWTSRSTTDALDEEDE